MRFPIIITRPTWSKMIQVLKDTNQYAFLFSAKGGGCNGFNYTLKAMNEMNVSTLFVDSTLPPMTYSHDERLLYVDPVSEMLLMGTTIDYVQEDYSKQIYESKFTFTPRKELATSCGCGVSFSPRIMESL